MAQSIEESLLQAVKKDDIKAFNALMEKAQCGTFRLGRFPVLSVLYLYKSRKILSAYEERFLKITSFEELREPVEVSKKFALISGKCLRLYLSEIVSPLEMLLILDRVKRLKRVYPLTKPSSAVKGRLQSIYSIKYSLSVKFEGDDIIIDRRPLSCREKKRIATACLCTVLAVTVAVGVPVTTVALMPKPVEGEVKKLSQIDFNSKKEYTLKKDIVLPENYSVEKVNCKISGNGKKLTFGKGAVFGEFNGKMSGVTIVSSGSPIITTVSSDAVLENLTVNVSADVVSNTDTALVVSTNYGTIENVTVNLSGKISALTPDADGVDELIFGGLVQTNAYRNQQAYGVVKNCTVNFTDFSIAGETSANASFGGVAGVNSGIVEDCTVTGAIEADTFDIAGVCMLSNGLLLSNINEANLSQTSADTEWNPIASGIVIESLNTVENCVNRGTVTAVSDCGETDDYPTASSAGVVYLNRSSLTGCVNRGAVTAKGKGAVYAGGISSRSFSQISYCLSNGDINAEGNKVYAGGILGSSEVYYTVDFFGYNFAWGSADYCISESRISVTAGEAAGAGGIVGLVRETPVEVQEGNILYFGGGATHSFFAGECAGEVNYFGNIVGVCGANIYESNSYTSGYEEYHNFEGNYYLNNSLPACGAVDTADGNFAPAGDNGGATSASEEDIKNSEDYKKISDYLLNF